MPEVHAYAPGSFCWPELATSDAAAAKSHYTRLLGWEAFDTPGGFYTIFRKGGKDVAGAYSLGPAQREAGVPPHWLSYISVEDADDTARRAAALGAAVLAAPFDVMGIGRMAMLRDPTGAPFAAWQGKGHIGSRLRDEPGTPCWYELATRNVDRARDFYTDLFDWGIDSMPVPGAAYTVFKSGAASVAGMLAMGPESGDLPPRWMPYIAVADCDAAAARAAALGGRVCHPPTDIPNVGRFAVLDDPQGAALSVIRPS